jgi:hypothetical protein
MDHAFTKEMCKNRENIFEIIISYSGFPNVIIHDNFVKALIHLIQNGNCIELFNCNIIINPMLQVDTINNIKIYNELDKKIEYTCYQFTLHRSYDLILAIKNIGISRFDMYIGDFELCKNIVPDFIKIGTEEYILLYKYISSMCLKLMFFDPIKIYIYVKNDIIPKNDQKSINVIWGVSCTQIKKIIHKIENEFKFY